MRRGQGDEDRRTQAVGQGEGGDQLRGHRDGHRERGLDQRDEPGGDIGGHAEGKGPQRYQVDG
ncbi:hypothetical protein D3C85_1403320 [compost metagenome]